MARGKYRPGAGRGRKTGLAAARPEPDGPLRRPLPLRAVRGVLAGFADILIDIHLPPGDRGPRRRHFHGVGRYPGTLAHVAAELNPEGTDYLLLPDAPPASALAPALATLRQVQGQSPGPLTRQEILARWPEPVPPRANSLGRVLARGCEWGPFVRSGEGTRAEAFRYGLAPGLASA